MSQESVLRVGVDSSGAESGANRVNAAMQRMSAQIDKVTVTFQKLQGSMQSTSGSANTLSAAFAGISAAAAARGMINLLDSSTNLDNRIRLVTRTTEEMNAVYAELLRISNATRTPLEANAQVFGRMSLAMRGMGMTYRETLAFTESLNQAVVISGATSTEATAALIQLSQGMASGALRGDELRSVMEQLPKVSLVLAEGMGITVGQLRTMGAEGKITAQMMVAAFKKAGPSLAAEFAVMRSTISGAFAVVQNNLLDLFRNLNNGQGVGAAFAKVINVVADNVDVLATAFAALATVMMLRIIPAIAAMGLAFAATPFGAVVVGVVAVTTALASLSKMTFKVGGDTVTGGQVMTAAWMTFKDYMSEVWDWLKSTWMGDWASSIASSVQSLGPLFAASFDVIVFVVKSAFNSVVGAAVGSFEAVKIAWGALPAFFELILKKTVNLVITGLEKIVNAFVAALASIGYAVDYFTGGDLGDSIMNSLRVDIGKLNIDEAADEVAGASEKISAAFSESMSKDYAGSAADSVADKMAKNLKKVEAESKAAGAAQDVLDRRFSTTAQAAAKAAEGVDAFQKSLQKSFDAIREANGGAAAVAEEWFVKEKAKLVEMGLEHTKYAGMVAAVFQDKIQSARVKDVENTAAWAVGLTAVQRDAASKIREEWQQLPTTYNGNTQAAQEWYTQQKRILEAAGLANSVYAQQVDQIFANKIKEARKKDLENATDWLSGMQRAMSSLNDQYGSTARLTESIFSSAFDKMSDALATFITTGKLDFRSFAQSVIADIARIIAKMMLVKALDGIMGGFGSGGGSILSGLIPGFATGGSFTVAGSGGVDSNLVAFNATRGERVTVETPEQQRNSETRTPVVLQMTIHATDAQSFKASETQVAAQMRRMMQKAQRRA